MANANLKDMLDRTLLDGLSKAFKEIADKMIVDFSEEYKRRCEEKAGEVAIRVAKYSDVMWDRDRLLITVKIGEGNERKLA
jgi:hypothetical protein